jgi:hypothetical protein
MDIEPVEKSVKPRALPEGCMILILAGGCIIVGFFTVAIASTSFERDSEYENGARVFFIVCFSAAVVFALWGMSLLIRDKQHR